MKVNMDGAPIQILNPGETLVGNVYLNQKGTLYLIVAIKTRPPCFGDDAIALVIDREGDISNAVRYSAAYFNRLRLVGRSADIGDINVEWFDSL